LLILASGSKARLELLTSVGIYPDKIIQTNTDETVHKNELPAEYVMRIADKKNKNVGKVDEDLVLSADTVIAIGRRILNKPKDTTEARKFLDLLSGRRHKVMTGVCLFARGKYYRRLVKTTLRMKRLSDLEKKNYLTSQEWRERSGGYAIQGKAAYFFPFISGSYSNIVGLPLTETVGLLNGVGYQQSILLPAGSS
jgi:septum formation protein